MKGLRRCPEKDVLLRRTNIKKKKKKYLKNRMASSVRNYIYNPKFCYLAAFLIDFDHCLGKQHPNVGQHTQQLQVKTVLKVKLKTL